jgi:hypothetical protein
MMAVLVVRCWSSQAVPPSFYYTMRMMRQRRGSNNKRRGRIERKRPITVIRVVIATLMTMEPTSKTTTNVKAYHLPNSTSCLLMILL